MDARNHNGLTSPAPRSDHAHPPRSAPIQLLATIAMVALTVYRKNLLLHYPTDEV
jgi:hypothetical protein